MSRGLKIVFLIHAIVSLIYGVVFFLIPATWADLFNWTPFDPAITRFMGAALLALAVSSWFGYRASRWEQVQIVVQMEIAFTVLGALGGLYEVLFAKAPTANWINVVVVVVFAVAWIYFYSKASSTA